MYPKAYIEYLVHFHGDRDYFECHEVLEEHWKEEQPKQRKAYWVGLIQIAVGLYHHRRNNWKGALRMMTNALAILEKEKEALLELGLDPAKTALLLRNKAKDIQNKVPYQSIQLPISDDNLLNECIEYCTKHQLQWGSVSNMNDEFLLHKHTRRDRSEVIIERKKSLALRQQKKRDET
ncbi:DUF309 domain-containing protein [Metabacillus idriensis]|uniref:DUF309 domain-containing protein n=1 Tax=Metabacillus idriensis TaxID=324768 RepID=UPI00174CA450|nr:DUF309 domain-containing protein [Metabacillus idriensis]